MTKDELLDQIENDLEITQENINTKIYDIPGYHSKYLRYFFNSKLKLINKKKELSKLYKKIYYEIKSDSNYIMNNKEIEFNILGNNIYSELNKEVQTLENLVDILDRTIKKVNTLSFDIKNIISWKDYQQGTL